MTPIDLCFAGAAAQARLVRSRQVSATELVTATLERIEAVNPTINAYTVVLAEEALEAAAAIDNGGTHSDGGPLVGVPVAVKDSIDVSGQVTSLGTNAVTTAATTDSPLVASLRDAGAIIVGKTACSELVVWPFTETPAWGATRNPWDPDYSPGGSSGGSGAAVAAGLCGVAVGGDGLGSIRVPASFTGVFGVKPQRDRVWSESANWNGMGVNGPLGRTVEDAAVFLDAVSSPAQSFVTALATPVQPLRVAVAFKSAAYYPLAARLGTEQREAVEQTATILRQLGHTVEPKEVGFPQSMSTNYIVRYLTGVAETYGQLEQPDAVSSRTRQMAALGKRIPAKALRSVLDGEAKMAAKVNRIFEDYDVVLTPGAVEEPLKVGVLDGKGAVRTLYASGRKIPHFAPWNTIGQPAVSVPTGFSEIGLPLSVQLAGKPHDEALLLGLAAQLESANPWAHKRPPI